MTKSQTDAYWNERPQNEPHKDQVNIADLCQRELETDFLVRHVVPDSTILEVGCGNGYLTQTLRRYAAHVDAFDYSDNMIQQARALRGESNNAFFVDNVLAPQKVSGSYDTVVCVRVLINLRNLAEQKTALTNIAGCLKENGTLLLIEGYADGFDELNRLREQVSLTSIQPAPINYYSRLADLMPHIEHHYTMVDSFHTGCFDFLTRIVYPCLVGPANATGPGEFHEKILPVARHFNPPDFKHLARLHGFALQKR